MLYFANPSTDPVRAQMQAGRLGCIVTPKQGLKIPPGAVWCADNGAFGKGYPGDAAWLKWLASYSIESRATCQFAVAPDVVGDAEATIRRSAPWLPIIRHALGYPAAFVAQDGLERLVIPWDQFDVLFIGGTTEFKLSAAARDLTREAIARGKPVHMGRVNSYKRLALASEWGCESADGTFIKFGPLVNLPKVMTWLERINAHESTNQPDLWR